MNKSILLVIDISVSAIAVNNGGLCNDYGSNGKWSDTVILCARKVSG